MTHRERKENELIIGHEDHTRNKMSFVSFDSNWYQAGIYSVPMAPPQVVNFKHVTFRFQSSGCLLSLLLWAFSFDLFKVTIDVRHMYRCYFLYQH